MRHYMVDPDNEERLLKVPPRVVKSIRNEFKQDCVTLITEMLFSDDGDEMSSDARDWAEEIRDRIKKL